MTARDNSLDARANPLRKGSPGPRHPAATRLSRAVTGRPPLLHTPVRG